MHPLPPLGLVLSALSLLVAATTAQAIGFGRPPAQVALGSPLNFALPLRVEPDESFDPSCVQAEAHFGEQRIGADRLRWRVEPGADANERVLRVISLVAVDEPVVTVQVTNTCGTRLTRRFTAFADPPNLAAEPPMADVATARAAPVPRAPLPRPAQPAVPRAAPRASDNAAPRTAPVAPPSRKVAARAARKGYTAPATPPLVAAAPVARLSLEAPDPELLAQAVAAAVAEQRASAAESAAATAQAASAAAARIKGLEDQVERLLADSRQQRDEVQKLQARASMREAATRWTAPLVIAVVALALLAAWLALRVRRVRREAEDKWYADAAAVLADAQPDPEDPAAGKPTGQAGGSPRGHAAAPLDLDLALEHDSEPSLRLFDDTPPSVAPTLQAAVAAEPATWSQTSPPPRPMSAEELIDLEQQAEFFIVLGQDEAAIDLLMAHLRDSGGISPLPYLKLLEIQRRRGEREAYERTRSRFNQRFNAYAPAWDSDLLQGRLLEDYPQVIARLQRAWGRPIDAMAELEALLFRKDDGELFDLSAYRELLLVYGIARDLADDAQPSRIDVDLLLPLEAALQRPDDVGTPFDRTEVLPRLSLIGEKTMVLTPGSVPERPTTHSALDLDISAADDGDAAPPASGHLRRSR